MRDCTLRFNATPQAVTSTASGKSCHTWSLHPLGVEQGGSARRPAIRGASRASIQVSRIRPRGRSRDRGGSPRLGITRARPPPALTRRHSIQTRTHKGGIMRACPRQRRPGRPFLYRAARPLSPPQRRPGRPFLCRAAEALVWALPLLRTGHAAQRTPRASITTTLAGRRGAGRECGTGAQSALPTKTTKPLKEGKRESFMDASQHNCSRDSH